MLRHGRFQPRLSRSRFASSGDPYGRTFLADASTGLLLPGFAYTRSGPDLWCPQADGSLASFAANVIPREFAGGRWGFRFDPGWTQYIARTHDFSHSTWTKRRATVVPVSIATPDGIGSAFKLVEDTTAANSHYLESEFVNIAATRGCFIVKAGEVTEIGVRYIRDTGVSFGGANARVDLLTGAVTLGTLNVEPLAGGWWKVTGIPDGSATTNVSIRLSLVRGGSETYTGDGVGGVYVLAANATSTAYPVPLTAANGTAGTVGAANCTALLSGLGVALGAEYTVGLDYTAVTTATDRVVMGLSSGAFANSIYVIPRNGSGNQSFSMLSGNAAQLDSMSTNAAGIGERQRAVLRAKANDSRAAVNGIMAPQDTACVLPVGLTNVRLAGAPWGGPANDFSGLVHGLWLVPTKALNDTQVQDLSRLTLEDVGAVSILRNSDRYVRPGLTFSRAAEVYEPQADGSMVAYSGSQVPWGANGVRLDPGWLNYALHSIDLTQGAWGKTRCSASSMAFANPFGGAVISKIIEDTSVSLSHLAQSSVTTSVAGSSYTARAILYPDERKHAALCFTGGGGGTDRGVFVDLLTGAITGAFGSYPASYGATLRVDGGVDVFITEAAPGAAGYAARVYLCSAQNISVYTGDGISGLRVAALNLTNTAYPVPFTVAQGSAVTVPEFSFAGAMLDAGVTLGSEFALIAKWRSAGTSAAFGTVLRLDNGTNSERAIIRRNSTSHSASAVVAAAGTAHYSPVTAAPAGQRNYQVLRVRLNDARGALNGALMAADDGTAPVPSVNRITIGHGVNASSEVFMGEIEELAIIPTSGLSAAQLQALSTL